MEYLLEITVEKPDSDCRLFTKSTIAIELKFGAASENINPISSTYCCQTASTKLKMSFLHAKCCKTILA